MEERKCPGLIRCSLSSVYRVLHRCGALVRRPRKPKPVWTRYAKASPGERAQMDLKYLPQDRYQLPPEAETTVAASWPPLSWSGAPPPPSAEPFQDS